MATPNLRQQEFNKWCTLQTHGNGVALYTECPFANRWLEIQKGLSSAERRTAIKLQGNVSPVGSLHARSQDGTHCKHYSEKETLAHILGYCPRGELLRNVRHHRIRSKIVAALSVKNYEVFEEVHCLATNGSTRRADIIAIEKSSRRGFIIDPTVRFETDVDQPLAVDNEKKSIYEPTIPYFQQKYKIDNFTVIGLMIGSRGTVPKLLLDFTKKIRHTEATTVYTDVALLALKGSIELLNNHLYSLH